MIKYKFDRRVGYIPKNRVKIGSNMYISTIGEVSSIHRAHGFDKRVSVSWEKGNKIYYWLQKNFGEPTQCGGTKWTHRHNFHKTQYTFYFGDEISIAFMMTWGYQND